MSNTNEVWLDIPEYEDEYQVSSLGRVLRKKTNEIKTPSHNRGNGLWNYKLSKNGVVKTYTAAKLVALAFIMNPNPKLYRYAICKNGDKNDYTVNNIIWATPRQCVEAKNKRFPELKGKFVYKGPPPTQKMNDVLIKQLLDLYSVGYSTRQLEDIFPIKKSRIATIVREKANNQPQAQQTK